MKNKVINKKHNVFAIVLFVVLLVYSISFLFPLLWGLMTSFKDVNRDYASNLIGFPKKFVLTNYINVWNNISYPVVKENSKIFFNFFGLMKNSVFYAVGCSLCATFFPFLVGYLTARFNYKFSKFINVMVVVIMMIPIVGALPSEIQVAQTLGLYDTWIGIFIMQSNFLGMYYLVFYAAFKSVPNDYAEAAEIDGASNIVVMFRIIMPMLKTTFMAVLLLKFIYYWNEYYIANIYIKSYPTISVALLRLNTMSQKGLADPPGRLACSMLLCIPIIIVFLIFKNKIMGNVSLGGIKG